MPGTIAFAAERPAIVRKGILLSYFTIGYNCLEAVVSLVAGFLAGSIALVGFGIDSVIEVTASGVAQWRLRMDVHTSKRPGSELIALRIIGWSFLALAVYVTTDSIRSLYLREEPDRTWLGLSILLLSVVVMPILARAKRRVANAMDSRALEAEAKQTSLCAYLSVIALIGVALNVLVGWWWADPIAALGMVPIIAKEGLHGVRATLAEDCC